MGQHSPLQKGQTLYCVTDQHTVFPVTIATIAEISEDMTAVVTALPENCVIPPNIASQHNYYFKELFFKNGKIDSYPVFSEQSEAVALALHNAKQEAKILADQVERNSKRIYELNKLTKEISV